MSFLKIPHSIKYFVQNRYNSCEKNKKRKCINKWLLYFEQKLKSEVKLTSFKSLPIKFSHFRPKILHRSTGKRNHVKTYQDRDQLTAGFGRFWPLQLTSGGLFFNALKNDKENFTVLQTIRQQQSTLNGSWVALLQTRNTSTARVSAT